MLQLRERIGGGNAFGITALDAGDGVLKGALLLIDDRGRQWRNAIGKLLGDCRPRLIIDLRPHLRRVLAEIVDRLFQNSDEICHASGDLHSSPAGRKSAVTPGRAVKLVLKRVGHKYRVVPFGAG